ncbi:hypothetical protein GCM10008997_14480 [Halomonas salifodinae]
MTVPRIRVTWWLIMAWMLSAPPVLGAAWPLADIDVEEAATQISRYVYVPEGQRFGAVSLNATLLGQGGEHRLMVRLDGDIVHLVEPHGRQTIRAALPDLTPGFHRLDFLGWPARYMADESLQERCPMPLSRPFQLRELSLDYRPRSTGEVALKHLPDGLFNRGHPGGALGHLTIEAGDEDAYTAAARLVSWLDRQADLRWETGTRPGEVDFVIDIRHDAALAPPARVALIPARWEGEAPRPATLEIRYRQVRALHAAVLALLDVTQRDQLLDAHADFDVERREPVWARLREPRTLAELGLEDIRLASTGQATYLLDYPPHWQPTGVPRGQLLLRGQAGLPQGAHLNLWMEGALSGSQPLHELASHNIERTLPLAGVAVPERPRLTLELAAELEVTRHCYLPLQGDLWIDAEESEVGFEYVPKAGLMALIPRLIAAPSVRLPEDHAEAGMQLLTALMRAHRQAATPDPVPYRVRLAGDGRDDMGEAPSVEIRVEPAMADRLQARFPERLQPGFAEGALWWRADEQGRGLITAASPEVLRRGAAVLPEHWWRIPDGTREALLHAQDGTLVVLAHRPTPVAAPSRALSRDQLHWGLIAVATLFALIVLWLVWWRRRQGA